MKYSPFVSIIIPCRNEEKFISQCLDSLLQNDYPKNLMEILVVDGASQDATQSIIKSYSKKYDAIHLLDNPKLKTPIALNIGIHHAKGKVIIRADAHATYDKQYIPNCVKHLYESRAD